MNIEDKLSEAWNATTDSTVSLAALTAKVQRQQRRRQLQRALEVLLSLVAIAVFSHAMITHSMRPAHWLLLPFFAVFLPMVWTLTLRAPKLDTDATSAAANVYAQLRMAQLKTSLRDLWLARRTSQGLLLYALLAAAGSMLFGDAQWRESALVLLIYAVIWWLVTLLLARRLGQRWLREQHNLQALLHD